MHKSLEMFVLETIYMEISRWILAKNKQICASPTGNIRYKVWTRTTRTPALWWYPLPPHDYPYYWVILDPKSEEDKVKVTNLRNSPKFQFFKFWNKHYTLHTFLSCLIRCANMKWIRQVLLKIQRHNSVHRRTDGQTDKVKPVYPPFNFVEMRIIIIMQIIKKRNISKVNWTNLLTREH